MKAQHEHQAVESICGYLEGYYGKLLSWSERSDLLKFLSKRHLNTYCYAPKEDTKHRLHWREFYSPQWRESFAQFCQLADELQVSIVAGIAPGLDFKFEQKGSNTDFNCLQNKAKELQKDGATEILILWDDIDDMGFTDKDGLSEGAAHAHVVNRLAKQLGRALWTVPRVYADEIENKNNYLEDFFAELQPHHTVLLCGKAIVAQTVCPQDLTHLSRSPVDQFPAANHTPYNLKHRTVVWDNFYANDYCPRRLFLGPWTGRENINDYLLNPTGLPYTDRLLLDIAVSTHTSTDRQRDWIAAMKRHGVPDAFLVIAPYFSEPFFGDRAVLGDHSDTLYTNPTEEVEQAIEKCLWQWKSPLAREWYPLIFGLKHDLALEQGTLPTHRVLKTQPAVLASKLLR